MLTRICSMLLASSAIIQCGGDGYVKNSTTPDAAWAGVAPVIQANCGKCHQNFSSAAAFKGSAAKARLTAGTMPPAPDKISADDKAKLLAYLQ